MYACQLWNNFLSSSLKGIRLAYNNSFQFLHGVPFLKIAHTMYIHNLIKNLFDFALVRLK